MIDSQSVEVVLIGAGPIGLEMAAALKTNDIAYRHFEAGNIGHTIGWYAPGTPIFSSPERLEIAGVPFAIYPGTRATREEYLTYLRAVARFHQLRIESFRRVVAVRVLDDGRFQCDIARSDHGVGGPSEFADPNPNGEPEWSVVCRKLILAIGDMHRPRELGIPGERLPFVSHYLGEPHQYFGRRVVIVGGKNSAAEAAIRLQRQYADILLVHRGDDLDETRVKPWLLPEVRLLVREGKMGFRPRTEVVEILPGSILLKNRVDGVVTRESCDCVLLLTGYRQDTTLFDLLGLETIGDGRAPVYNPTTMETSRPNVFVAGTCSAGTQLGGVTSFIETSHIHVQRIIEAIGGRHSPVACHTRLRDVGDREQ